MKNVKLPANLKATGSLTKEVYDANHVLLFAIPTEHLRATLTSMKPLMKPDHLIILANKVYRTNVTSLTPLGYRNTVSFTSIRDRGGSTWQRDR